MNRPSQITNYLLPPAPLDDSIICSSCDIVTQNTDSVPMAIADPAFATTTSDPKLTGFQFSPDPHSKDHIDDMDVTTQVLDELDALETVLNDDQMPKSPQPSDSKMDIEEAAPLHSNEAEGPKRVLPDWMTKPPPPVVTRRSLFLSTQTRHRKKQEILDAHEESSDSAFPYIDILRPSDMSLDRVICFDVESTGFAKTDGIIEIGAVEFVLGQRTGALFQSYIKPSVPVNQHAADVHGLTNLMLANAPPARIVIPSFLSWVGNSPLVAHNARFDMRMLLQEAARLGIEDTLIKKPVFCTMRSYRKLHPGRPYALIDLYTNLLGAKRYASNSQICNPKLPNHSAIVDSEILGEVFLELCADSLETNDE